MDLGAVDVETLRVQTSTGRCRERDSREGKPTRDNKQQTMGSKQCFLHRRGGASPRLFLFSGFVFGKWRWMGSLVSLCLLSTCVDIWERMLKHRAPTRGAPTGAGNAPVGEWTVDWYDGGGCNSFKLLL